MLITRQENIKATDPAGAAPQLAKSRAAVAPSLIDTATDKDQHTESIIFALIFKTSVDDSFYELIEIQMSFSATVKKAPPADQPDRLTLPLNATCMR
jgi:hypothetical protein